MDLQVLEISMWTSLAGDIVYSKGNFPSPSKSNQKIPLGSKKQFFKGKTSSLLEILVVWVTYNSEITRASLIQRLKIV
jgi:hypothetical protein